MRLLLICTCVFLSIFLPGMAASAEGKAVPNYLEKKAQAVAIDFWAEKGWETSCDHVKMWSKPMSHGIIAFVPSNPFRPLMKSICEIRYNSNVDWRNNYFVGKLDRWWKICRVTIHEWGHLPGMWGEPMPYHSDNKNSIMYPNDGVARWYPYFPACKV